MHRAVSDHSAPADTRPRPSHPPPRGNLRGRRVPADLPTRPHGARRAGTGALAQTGPAPQAQLPPSAPRCPSTGRDLSGGRRSIQGCRSLSARRLACGLAGLRPDADGANSVDATGVAYGVSEVTVEVRRFQAYPLRKKARGGPAPSRRLGSCRSGRVPTGARRTRRPPQGQCLGRWCASPSRGAPQRPRDPRARRARQVFCSRPGRRQGPNVPAGRLSRECPGQTRVPRRCLSQTGQGLPR